MELYDQKTLADKFLNQLPTVGLTELEANSECDICHESYTTDGENAIRLPCGHILGSECISLWILPTTGQGQNTCPFCRRSLYQSRQEWKAHTSDERNAEMRGQMGQLFGRGHRRALARMEQLMGLQEIAEARETLHWRERWMYHQLQRSNPQMPALDEPPAASQYLGSPLPHLPAMYKPERNFWTCHEEALFEGLQRAGAFFGEPEGIMSDRKIWAVHRHFGQAYWPGCENLGPGWYLEF